jgi:D-alanyl-D-alanine dipeptidase
MKQGAPEPIAALNRVRIVENGEPLVDIREFCPQIVVTPRVCPYLRRTVAEMLNRAASSLPDGFSFRAATALRTLARQKKGWERFYRAVQKEHPEWSPSALRRATNRYYAPYNQKAPPGHCTGAAVDVVLLGPGKKQTDVTSPYQRWDSADTWTDKISPNAKHNRMIMVRAMLDAGFSNCRDEFWHYSYGDSAWAVRVGEASCPYGLVEPPVSVESDYLAAAAARIEKLSEGGWLVTADPAGRIDIGIYWSVGVAVLLKLVGENPRLPLYVSKDRKGWKPLAPSSEGAVSIVPRFDRIYLTNAPPGPPQLSL